MSSITKPLHVGTVCGHPVRFFKTPNDDGRPDFPWLSIDDLQQALGFSRSLRKFFLHKLKNDWGKGASHTIATDGGLVTIVPHDVAQGCISASIERMGAPAKAEWEYAHASMPAMQALMAHLTFGTDEWFQYMKAAMNKPSLQRQHRS